jgi:hypothetical protein
MKIKHALLTALIVLGLFLIQNGAIAQCAMCKAVAESNIDNNSNSVGKGLNTGILYLMLIPYLIIGSIFFFSFKKQIIAYVKGFTITK